MTRAETERHLLALITLEPGLSVTGLHTRSGLPAPYISRTLKRLEAEGRVRIENTPEPQYSNTSWRCYPVAS
jgi:DNA-binding MarR family transcriptional regulator